MDSWEDSRINEKKEILAFELTKLVHGEEEAVKAREASHALFAGGGDDSTMPTTEFAASDIPEEGMNIMDVLVKTGLAASKSEARRLIQQGGISVDGEKVSAIDAVLTKAQFEAGAKLKKGKKVFHKVVLG